MYWRQNKKKKSFVFGGEKPQATSLSLVTREVGPVQGTWTTGEKKSQDRLKWIAIDQARGLRRAAVLCVLFLGKKLDRKQREYPD